MKRRMIPLILGCLVLFGTGCAAPAVPTKASVEASVVKKAMLAEELSGHPLMAHFKVVYGELPLVTGIAGDCNQDGAEDLVIVYQPASGDNHLVTVYSAGGEYRLTEPIAAPVEDCLLQWNDIDERPPMELMVSGRKGVHLGYAIYRFEGGAWVSLFGDGMDDCC